MVLIGYLAFLDPPKESASQAIKQLHEHGVEVKVLSGDNEAVVKAISRQVGINTSASVTGPELENMSQEAKQEAVVKCSIFSKLTPMQKSEIIQLLQKTRGPRSTSPCARSVIPMRFPPRIWCCRRCCRRTARA